MESKSSRQSFQVLEKYALAIQQEDPTVAERQGEAHSYRDPAAPMTPVRSNDRAGI